MLENPPTIISKSEHPFGISDVFIGTALPRLRAVGVFLGSHVGAAGLWGLGTDAAPMTKRRTATVIAFILKIYCGFRVRSF
jgi:hypothetical protein